MQTIVSGSTQLGLSNPVQDIILGIIIVAAVTVAGTQMYTASRSAKFSGPGWPFYAAKLISSTMLPPSSI